MTARSPTSLPFPSAESGDGTAAPGRGVQPDEGAPVPTLVSAFAAVYLIWGSTYLAIRFALETLPPFLMAAARFLVAGAALYLWCRLRGVPRPEGVHWRAAAVSGFFMLLMGVGGVTWAEQFVPSGLAALIVSTVPLWLALMAWVGPDGLRPGPGEGAGIVLGLAGVAILVLPGGAFPGEGRVEPLGAAVLLTSAVAWAFGSLYGKSAPRPDSHLFGVALLMLAGGGWLTLTGLLTGETSRLVLTEVSTLSVLSLLYLVVFGSIIAFSAYVWLLKVASPAQVGTYAFVNPVVAVYLGWALAGEPLTPRIALAAAIIVVGVALIVWRRPKAAGKDEKGPPAKRPGVGKELTLQPQPEGAGGGGLILRIWRGATVARDAARYYEYLRKTGIREYRRTPGNRGVWVLRSKVDGRAEFLLLTLWESMESVRAFAGPEPERAVFYPEDDAFLLERGERVEHFEVLEGPDGERGARVS